MMCHLRIFGIIVGGETFVMSDVAKTVILSWFFFLLITQAQHIGSPMGFANVPAYGVGSITGGSGGEVVRINGQADAKKLQDALDDDDKPRIIYISGSVQLPRYAVETESPVADLNLRMTAVKSNKTILGLGKNAKIIKSGLSIYSGSGEGNPQNSAVRNIIIQNLTFEAAPDDAINIQGGSHHIWVDHCTFTDGPGGPLKDGFADGQLDYKRGSDYLTVSYCLFTNHYKMSLVGHSNKVGHIDKGFLRATYDHCFFNDRGGKASTRHPRVRFGIVHVVNCFIQGVEKDRNTEGVVSQCEAKVFVEGCHFRYAKWGGSVNEHSEGDGLLEEKNNSYDSCSKRFSFIQGARFNPADYFQYNYMPEKSTDLPATLPGKVGAGILDIRVVSIESGNPFAAVFKSPLFVDNSAGLLLITGRDNGKGPASVINVTGRAVIHNRALKTHAGGYALGIQDITPGNYILTTPDCSVIGRFIIP